jgi:hypothetical protein
MLKVAGSATWFRHLTDCIAKHCNRSKMPAAGPRARKGSNRETIYRLCYRTYLRTHLMLGSHDLFLARDKMLSLWRAGSRHSLWRSTREGQNRLFSNADRRNDIILGIRTRFTTGCTILRFQISMQLYVAMYEMKSAGDIRQNIPNVSSASSSFSYIQSGNGPLSGWEMYSPKLMLQSSISKK